MQSIKSYTDIEQSKKLAEILPLKSADMSWYTETEMFPFELHTLPYSKHFVRRDGSDTLLPCWSLAALLGVLPNNKHITTTLSRGGWKIEPIEYIDKWFCDYENEADEDSPCKNFSVSADNPVDACYEMILKLHELKML